MIEESSGKVVADAPVGITDIATPIIANIQTRMDIINRTKS
jgi:hypothetical protein